MLRTLEIANNVLGCKARVALASEGVVDVSLELAGQTRIRFAA